jgi:diaminobutyrate-2-oxoglutarate transaminase
MFHNSMTETSIDTFEQHESAVRAYCRSFPAVFSTATGAEITDENGNRWIDFFAGAGALNYGHNPPFIRDLLVRYLQSNGITHALDMHTTAKRAFIDRFVEVILKPRGLDYRLQFCGPTGANAVEAALKLARKITGRTNVAAFTGGWHGMSTGCLAVNSRRDHRLSAGFPLGNATMFPFPVGPRNAPDALNWIEHALTDSHSGLDIPAAFILEAVQAEGGVYVAPDEFVRGLREIADRYGIVFIVDDIQAGCGRTGTFFSFESSGIVPDLVCLSKSISGYGLPMSLVLIGRGMDVWAPGEHTGTFRGHQLAFLAAEAALKFWEDDEFGACVRRTGEFIRTTLRDRFANIEVRGKGMLIGIDLAAHGGGETAQTVVKHAFASGLIVETCGRDGAVIKIIPPLNIDRKALERGLDILTDSMRAALALG